ncbi:MAG: hypothetical protein BWK78_08795 [Thiotrichaceae bacterium IS1]|nr:MAG: hypothetical protein BWK78_08795 [Thiotrichaceae bacterium IS1]
MVVEIKDIHFSPAFRKKAEKWVIRIKSSIIKETRKLEYKKVRKLNKLLINSFYNWVVQIHQVAPEGKDNSRGDGKTLRIWNKGRVLNTKELVEWRTRAIEVWRRNQSYQPKKLKRIYIPKPDGTERPLSIPTWFDQIIQAIIGNVVECQVESIIEANDLKAYGFRKGFKTADAIQGLQGYALTGKKQKLVEFDRSKFYETIPDDKLLAVLENVDRYTRNNIEKMLKNESLDLKGIVTKPEMGTPQGGNISPILANLYASTQIMLPFKKESQSKLTMYADDGIIICDNKENPEMALAKLEAIAEKAGLKLKKDKTKIIDGDRFNFLGYEITRGKGIRLQKDMIKKCQKDGLELIKNKSIPTKATVEKGSRVYLDKTPNHKFATIYSILDKILPKYVV